MFKKAIVFALIMGVIALSCFLYSGDDYLFFKEKSQYEPLLIYDSFSGKYLGCLNCSHFDPNSIYNPFGKYGSEYSPDSIWNTFGAYGSEFSLSSPWDPFSFDPPVIKNSFGIKIGYLSSNPDLFLPTLNPKTLIKKSLENDFIFDFRMEDSDIFLKETEDEDDDLWDW